MKYKLTICDYDEIKKFTIKFFTVFILFLLFAVAVLSITPLGDTIMQFTIFFVVASFIIIFFWKFSQKTSKEELEFRDNAIISLRFGKINMKDITWYEYQEYKGASALVIQVKGGQKLNIGARSNLSNSAMKEFTEFTKEFEIQFLNSSNR